MDDVLDGNTAAGALSELFRVDMTTAMTICAACGDDRPVGALRAYVTAPGVVLRCTSCGTVQIRIVRDAGRAWLDFSGVRVCQIDVPTDPRAGVSS